MRLLTELEHPGVVGHIESFIDGDKHHMCIVMGSVHAHTQGCRGNRRGRAAGGLVSVSSSPASASASAAAAASSLSRALVRPLHQASSLRNRQARSADDAQGNSGGEVRVAGVRCVPVCAVLSVPPSCAPCPLLSSLLTVSRAGMLPSLSLSLCVCHCVHPPARRPARSYCEGGDLAAYLKHKKGIPMRDTEILYHFVQMALALMYMHEKNILHRDLKTQNIFIKNGLIQLGDFGISKALTHSNDFAQTCIGTPYVRA